MTDIMVRIPQDLIDKLRKTFPEIGEESDATLVRVAIRKLLYHNPYYKYHVDK